MYLRLMKMECKQDIV